MEKADESLVELLINKYSKLEPSEKLSLSTIFEEKIVTCAYTIESFSRVNESTQPVEHIPNTTSVPSVWTATAQVLSINTLPESERPNLDSENLCIGQELTANVLANPSESLEAVNHIEPVNLVDQLNPAVPLNPAEPVTSAGRVNPAATAVPAEPEVAIAVEAAVLGERVPAPSAPAHVLRALDAFEKDVQQIGHRFFAFLEGFAQALRQRGKASLLRCPPLLREARAMPKPLFNYTKRFLTRASTLFAAAKVDAASINFQLHIPPGLPFILFLLFIKHLIEEIVLLFTFDTICFKF